MEEQPEVDPKLVEAVVKAVLSAQPPSVEAEAPSMYLPNPKPPFGHGIPGWAISVGLGLLAFFASQTFDSFKGTDGQVTTKIDQILTSVSDIKASLARSDESQRDTNRRVENVEHDMGDLRQRVDDMQPAPRRTQYDRGARP